jgi:hypothetical protein
MVKLEDSAGQLGLMTPAIVRGVISATRLVVDIEPGRSGLEINLILLGFDPEYDPFIEVDESAVYGSAGGRPMRTPSAIQFNRQRQLTPQGRKARDQVADWIDSVPTGPGRRHQIWFPRPMFAHGWVKEFQPQSTHGGYLFLNGQPSPINDALASSGLVPIDRQREPLRVAA